MEDGNLTVTAAASGAANTLISGQPCTLIGLYFSLDAGATLDPTALPILVEVLDEADTADIDANSKRLQRLWIADAANDGKIQRNLSIKAGKGICLKVAAAGTNDLLIGLTWR